MQLLQDGLRLELAQPKPFSRFQRPLASPHDTTAQSATALGPCAPDPIPMLYGSSAGHAPSTLSPSVFASGTHQTFAADAAPLGGMMTRVDAQRPPFWLYYVNVPEIGAAASLVREHGGEILLGPHQVPGGRWIVHCADPQGAMFAMLGTKQ